MRFGSGFLTDAASFPDAVAGEPWGGERRLLDLPGGPFHVIGLSARQAGLMDREYASVLVEGPSAGCVPHETAVWRVEPGYFRELELEGWTYTLDLEATAERLRIAALHFAALVPRADGAAAGMWTSVEDRWFQGVIENYLRVMVAHRLLLRGGLLLHSAGTVVDGSAFLFVGASGAGKSTVARKALAAGAPVLSDDLNAVVDTAGSPAVARLPFTGELRDQHAFDGTVPLAGIAVLGKGDAVSCEALGRAEAAAAIVATAPYINRGADDLEGLMAAAVALAERVPVARLTSARSSSFDEIERAVRGLQREP